MSDAFSEDERRRYLGEVDMPKRRRAVNALLNRLHRLGIDRETDADLKTILGEEIGRLDQAQSTEAIRRYSAPESMADRNVCGLLAHGWKPKFG